MGYEINQGGTTMMKKLIILSLVAIFLIQDNTKQAAIISSGVLKKGAMLEKLADGFGFTEGPVADKNGNVYFSDITYSRIHLWRVDGTLATFRENTGKSNGLAFDKAGNLIVCEGGNRRLTSIDPQGNLMVLADNFEGKKLNSPNDLWIDPKGGIYFTDPRYGDRSDLELDGEYVFYLTPDKSQLIKVIDDMVQPNGIVGTPDGKKLYVADRGADSNWVYTILADGRLVDKKFFCTEGSDGMKLDEKGNVYITSPRSEPHFWVSIFNPNGDKIQTIQVPEMPTNVCFWGKHKDKLFITDRGGIYSINLSVKGAF